MPSLHVAWLLWVCVVLWRVNARRTAHVFSAAHVLVVTVVIVVTANHYWLDAVAGAAVVWLADLATRRATLARHEP